jgi:hypothetical protein
VAEIESEDPIDWAMLSIDENQATELIVNQVVDSYNTHWSQFDPELRDRIFVATVAKLTLENFVLNIKLHQ